MFRAQTHYSSVRSAPPPPTLNGGQRRVKRVSSRCHLRPKAASCIRFDLAVYGALSCMENGTTSFDMPPPTSRHHHRLALSLMRYDSPGRWIRLRRTTWSGLPGHFRLGSGAGYTLVWLALALIPVFHGTAWWTTTVERPSVPALRGAMPGHWRGGETSRDEQSTDPVSEKPRYHFTSLRLYTPNYHYKDPIKSS